MFWNYVVETENKKSKGYEGDTREMAPSTGLEPVTTD